MSQLTTTSSIDLRVWDIPSTLLSHCNHSTISSTSTGTSSLPNEFQIPSTPVATIHPINIPSSTSSTNTAATSTIKPKYTTLSYNKDGTLLFIGTSDGQIICRHTVVNNNIHHKTHHKQEKTLVSITCSSWGSTPRQLAYGTSTGYVYVYDMKNCTVLTESHVSTSSITSLDYDLSDQYIAYTNKTGELYIYSLQSNTLKSTIQVSNSGNENNTNTKIALTSVTWSPVKKNLIAVSSEHGDIYVIDILTNTIIWKHHAHSATISSIKFTSHGILVSVSLDRRIQYYDVQSKTMTHSVTCDYALSSLDIHIDGYLIACGTVNGHVLLYNIHTPQKPLSRISMTHPHSSVTLCKFHIPTTMRKQHDHTSISSTSSSTGQPPQLSSKASGTIQPPIPLGTRATSTSTYTTTNKPLNMVGNTNMNTQPSVQHNPLELDIFSPVRQSSVPPSQQHGISRAAAAMNPSLLQQPQKPTQVSAVNTSLSLPTNINPLHARTGSVTSSVISPVRSPSDTPLTNNSPQQITTNVTIPVTSTTSASQQQHPSLNIIPASLNNVNTAKLMQQPLGQSQASHDEKTGKGGSGSQATSPTDDWTHVNVSPSSAQSPLTSTGSVTNKSSASSDDTKMSHATNLLNKSTHQVDSHAITATTTANTTTAPSTKPNAWQARQQQQQHQQQGLPPHYPSSTLNDGKFQSSSSAIPIHQKQLALPPATGENSSPSVLTSPLNSSGSHTHSHASSDTDAFDIYLQRITSIINDKLESTQSTIRNDVNNLHIELLRQFHLHEQHTERTLSTFISDFQSLVQEVKQLKAENDLFRQRYHL